MFNLPADKENERGEKKTGRLFSCVQLKVFFTENIYRKHVIIKLKKVNLVVNLLKVLSFIEVHMHIMR